MITSSGDKLLFVGQASLVDQDRMLAWAERSIAPARGKRWIIGKFVEADKPNLNGHYWSADDLRESKDTIRHSPLNMQHHARRVVGSIVDCEMVYPNPPSAEQAAEYNYLNPFIEIVAAVWASYFPEEFAQIQHAHDEGQLNISMECVAESMTCFGEDGCGETFEYQGPNSVTYCAHLQQNQSIRKLNNPTFIGGGLILPPANPAWPGANISDLVAASFGVPQVPDLTDKVVWENQMETVMARSFSAEERKKLAKEGKALSSDLLSDEWKSD